MIVAAEIVTGTIDKSNIHQHGAFANAGDGFRKHGLGVAVHG